MDRSRRNWKRGLALVLVVGSLAACGRDSDYLFYAKARPVAQQRTEDWQVSDVLKYTQIDVLWVIDNSGSMSEEQNAVIQNARVFMDEFTKKTKMAWRMGLLSTDVADSPYLGFPPAAWFDNTTVDPVSTFQYAVSRLGTNGSPDEEFFDPVRNAVVRAPNFVRAGAPLAVIIVTDEDEQSSMTPAAFAGFLDGLKGGNRDLLKVYGILGTTEQGCQGFNYTGSVYKSFFDMMPSKILSLCKDFGQTLSELGNDITKLVTFPKIFLKSRPRPGTLKVTFKGVELKGGPKDQGGIWEYLIDLNAVVFHTLDFALDQTQFVKVEYLEDNGY